MTVSRKIGKAIDGIAGGWTGGHRKVSLSHMSNYDFRSRLA